MNSLDSNSNIQQQSNNNNNNNSNSVALDSSSYSYLFNNDNNNKFVNDLLCDNEFLVFQSPAGGFESIDIINDSNNDNSFDSLELINSINNDDIINIYLSQLVNEENLIIEENPDVNNIQHY